MKRNKTEVVLKQSPGFQVMNHDMGAVTSLYDPHYDVDSLLARAEQAFKIRQYALNEHQRESLKKYGRSLVEEAVAKMDELNAAE